MEEQNKYYTPDISELHVGYECELSLQSSTGWYIFDFSGETPTEFIPFPDGPFRHWSKVPIIEKEDLFNPGREIQVFIDALKDNRVRTKYLDKEDIESCGWTDVKDVERWMGRPPMYTWSARKDNAMMGYNSEDHTIVIDVADPTKTVDGKKDEYNYPEIKYGRFRGDCKSINELRQIMKWLKIK